MNVALSAADALAAPAADIIGGPACYSIAEAAALLGVSRVTIWRWARSGRLPIRRLGHRTARVRREDLENLLTERAGPGSQPGSGQAATARAASDDDMAMVGQGHVVQFYTADDALVDAVARFIGDGLRAGEAALLIATEAHRASIEDRLHLDGLDVMAPRADGHYVSLNAAETLATMMVDGAICPERFVDVVGGAVDRAASGGHSVRAFGEMVALLLNRGELDAVIQLEQQWSDLLSTRKLALLCGYAIDSFDGEHLASLFRNVTSQHTRVIPTEEYTALAGPDERLRAIATLQQQSRMLQAEITRRKTAEERLRAALEAERTARETVEQARRRADFLSAASVTLASSLLDASTLDWVARLAVPALADWCVVDLAETDEQGGTRLRRIAAAHADPARERLILELQRRYPLLDSGVSHTAMRVLHSGQTWFDPAVSRERLEAEARDPAHFALGQALGFSAEMVIPLIARDRTLGTITLVRGDDGTFDEDDLAVAEELARRCAMAIANAQALASEAIARRDAQRAAVRIHRLQEITGQLSRSLEADDVLRSIAESAADLLQAPVGAVFLLERDGSGGDFTLAAAHGIDAERAPHLRLPRHGSLAGRAIDAGRTLVVDDVREDRGTALPALLTGQTTGSEIAAPITSTAGSLGVVKVFSPTVRRFSGDDVDLLTALAAAAAVALTNARLFHDAQDAIRTRDEFLSAAAHDLRTPLTSVKGLAQLLRRHALPTGSERLVQGLARIDATATKMGQQLDELTDLTRVQMGQQLELRKRPTDLVDLTQRIATEIQAVSDRHRIRIETTQASLIGTWDDGRLGRVLENLLSNAVKYSPNGGDVVVDISLADERGDATAVLAVTDQGLGVPVADLPQIFERFQRARNVAGRIGGTGIGLASARQIVEQHGGSIAVSSVEGAGSTFTVRLPLTTDASQPDPPGAEAGDGRP